MRFTEPGTYNLKIMATDDCGVTERQTRTVIVKEPPVTLTFECNGGLPLSPVLVEKGETYNLATKHTTKEDWLFDGWFDNPELTGDAITTILMDTDKTVYAKWVEERYRTYIFNSSSNVKTLGINIPETQLDSYVAQYGNYVASYDPWTEDEPYHFNSKSDQPWGAYRTQITRAVIGQNIEPRSLDYWFDGNTSLTYIDRDSIARINSRMITTMDGTFRDCTVLDNVDLSPWTSLSTRLESIKSCFQNCREFNNWNLTYFNTALVEDFSFAFAGIRVRNTGTGTPVINNRLYIAGIDFAHATNVAYMFSGADLDYLILGTSLTAKAFPVCTNFNSMFSNITAQGIICGAFSFGSGAITDTFMFGQAYNLVGGAGTEYDPDHILRDYAHPDGGSADPGYFRQTLTCTLTYVENGGVPIADNPVTIVTGDEITLAVTTKTDKVLEGWYLDSALTQKAGDGFHARFPESTTIYANWQDPQPEGTHYRFADGTLVLGVPDADLQRQVNIHGAVRTTYVNNPSATQSIFYNDRDRITSIECGSEKVLVQPTAGAFRNFSVLETADISKLVGDPTRNGTIDLTETFRNCMELVSVDASIDGGDYPITSTNMMFKDCTALTTVDLPDIPCAQRVAFDDASYWFESCTSLAGTLDFTNVCFDNVSTMSYLCNTCTRLQKVIFSPDMDTSNVENMIYLFNECTNLAEIENCNRLKTHSAILLTGIFARCSSLTVLDCSGFDTASTTGVSGIFLQCTNLRTIYASEKFCMTPYITHVQNVFSNCNSLVGGNGTPWQASYASDGAMMWVDNYQFRPGLFTKTTELTEAYAKYHVIDRTLTFFRDLPNAWSEEQTEDVYTYFKNIESTSDWEAKWPYSIKAGTRRILTDGSVYNLVGTRCMFKNFNAMLECDLRNFTFNGTDMSQMFSGCENLQVVYLGSNTNVWDVTNVTNMSYMFYRCATLTDIYIVQMTRTWDTQALTNTAGMFQNTTFGRLDLRTFDFSHVTDAHDMFKDNTHIVGIDVNPWKCFDLPTLVNGTDMFLGCTAVVGGYGTSYDPNYVGKERAVVDSASTPGYLAG